MDFYDAQRDLPVVCQAMAGAGPDASRFALLQQEGFVTDGHFHRAFYDDPMFTSMVVHRQRERVAKVDLQLLGVETWPFRQGLEPAPWPPVPQRLHCFPPSRRFQEINDITDVLVGLLFHDQHCVAGRDHRHIVESDGGKQAMVAAQIGIPTALGEDIADHGNAVIVAGRFRMQRRPGSDVGPSRIEADDVDSFG